LEVLKYLFDVTRRVESLKGPPDREIGPLSRAAAFLLIATEASHGSLDAPVFVEKG